MIGYAVSGLLVLVGLINLIPAVGAIAPERLRTLYGIEPDAPELLLLLRHRALLFALIGGFVVLAAFRPCLLYTSPSPRDKRQSRMPSSA